MADICVIYASEDEEIVDKLVKLLRNEWNVWWARDISHGPFEEHILNAIKDAKAVLPVISGYISNKPIFQDELDIARKQNKPVFPFVISDVNMPLGHGRINRTDAFGWNGDGGHKGFKQVREKITKVVSPSKLSNGELLRPQQLIIRGKMLKLPSFVFSLSSHETQISPQDGIKLFQAFMPATGLVSAYDAWELISKKQPFIGSIKQLKKTNHVLFLDSGNYEASRKNDRKSAENKGGWSVEKYREIAATISPDIAFSFDNTKLKGKIDYVVKSIVRNFRNDEDAIWGRDFPLCPIVHLPPGEMETIAERAAHIIAAVAAELNPIMIAVPERELGDGLRERFITVLKIRNALNALGKYYPLHLLGTGNPISMRALAVAGADSFDGLEWCRTVADYDNGRLYHFQHLDLFQDIYLLRLQQRTKDAIENPKVEYSGKVGAYNLDFFSDWAQTSQNMIHTGQGEYLLKLAVPNIGTMLSKYLSK